MALRDFKVIELVQYSHDLVSLGPHSLVNCGSKRSYMYFWYVYILACLLYIRELQFYYHFYLFIFYGLPLKYNRASPGMIGELNNLSLENAFLTSLTRAKPQFFFSLTTIYSNSNKLDNVLLAAWLWLAGEKDIQSRNLQLFMPRKFAFSSLESEVRIVLKNIRGFSNLDILH